MPYLRRLLFPGEGWLTIALVVFILICATWAVEAAAWVERLPSLTWVILAGGLLGYVFARMRRVPRPLLHLVAVLVGAFIIVWQTLAWLPQPRLESRLVALILRLNDWGYAARTGGVNDDPMVFVFTVTALAWLVGYLTAWFLFRTGRAWLALIPTGLALIINLRYAPSGISGFFLLYLLLALLLVVRFSLFEQHREWLSRRVRFNRDVGMRQLPSVTVFVMIVVAAAWILPGAGISPTFASALDTVSGPWSDWQGNVDRLFASLGARSDREEVNFGRNLSLKGAVHLGQREIFKVTATEPLYWRAATYDQYNGRGWNSTGRTEVPLDKLSESPVTKLADRKEVTQEIKLSIPRSNNVFAGGEPVSTNGISPSAEVDIPPPVTVSLRDRSKDDGLPSDIKAAVQILRQVQDESPNLTRGSGAGSLIGIANRALDAYGFTVQANARDPRNQVDIARKPNYYDDVASLKIAGGLKAWQSYQVVSSYSTAKASQLKAAGQDYPSWVQARYLQVPDELPERVKQLAHEWADSQAAPYEKALEIERKLREYTYTEDIPAPPANQDVVDYFLFEAKKGYCDYYASSMVMLLRVLGIPARLSSGYLTGEFDAATNTYTVRESNAHTWPEVYFPGYGWIEFEPTAQPRGTVPLSLTTRAREDASPASAENPDSLSTLPSSTGGTHIPEEDLRRFGEENEKENSGLGLPGVPGANGGTFAWEWLLLPLGLLLLACGGWLFWRRQYAGMSVARATYLKLNQLGRLARLGRDPNQTPHEYASGLGDALPGTGPPLRRIADAYTSAEYGRREPARADERDVAAAWRDVRKPLLCRVWRGGLLRGLRRAPRRGPTRSGERWRAPRGR